MTSPAELITSARECDTLNPERLQLWIDRLLQPERQQIKGQLRSANGMCCLGELSDISGLGKWNKLPGGASYDYEYIVVKQGSFSGSGTPPLPVIDWLGWPAADEAWSLNDTMGMTFPQIAEVLQHCLAAWKEAHS